MLAADGLHSHCQCFGFGTVPVVGYQQVDGEGTQVLVCGVLHLVGDDDDVKQLLWVVLLQETAHGGGDHPVFLVCGEEHDETPEGAGVRETGSPIELGGDGV